MNIFRKFKFKKQELPDNNYPITPICTNLRYDSTNEILYVNIGEINQLNLSGKIQIICDSEIIHDKSFKKLYSLPMCYGISFKNSKKNVVIEAILTLNDKAVKDKIVLNEENSRKPLSFEDWERNVI